MKRASLIATVLGGSLIGFSALSMAGTFTLDDEMLASVGEFEIGNGETHAIANNKGDEKYRICVRKARHSVPLKVIYDGKTQTVTSGNCSDFEAMSIKITPAGKLENDMVLLGKYEHLND